MASYNLKFKGYYLETGLSSVPQKSGIYMFYRCIPDQQTQKVDLKELIYIGKAEKTDTENLRERICDHFKTSDPLRLDKYLKDGEVLCFSYEECDARSIDVIENGLIFMQKPRANTELKYTLNHHTPISFDCEGACGLLKHPKFTIDRWETGILRIIAN